MAGIRARRRNALPSSMRTLYEIATGRPFTDPEPGDRKSECERVFQARDNSERFYCAHSDYIPAHLGEDETVAQNVSAVSVPSESAASRPG